MQHLCRTELLGAHVCIYHDAASQGAVKQLGQALW